MEDDRGAAAAGIDADLAKAVRGAVEEPVAPEAPLLVRLQKWASHLVLHTAFGFYLDTIQTILSLVACVMYVISTYLEDAGPIPLWVITFEWTVFAAFGFDYLLHLFIAENKLAHITSRGAVVDLLSILPILTVSSNARIGFLRVLRVFRIIRILRGYRTFNATGGSDSDTGVSRQVGMLIFILLSFIFMGAGFIHSVELMRGGTFLWPGAGDCVFEELVNVPRADMPPECRMDFFQAVYFVIITVTTVGYGDMIPVDNVGRIIIMTVLLPLFLIIPREVSKLSDLMERRSRFSKPFTSTLIPHVIVCGDIEYGVAVSFLAEFFHVDHGDQKMRVVFLAPKEPRGALEGLVSNPLFSEKVQYIRGTPLSTRDLEKAKLQNAQAVFVLTSQFSPKVDHRDVLAVLIIKAIKSITPWTSVFCQLVSPTNKVHRRWSDWDHVVCLQELRMGMLAKSALYPGFSTLVSNLIMSSSQIDVDTLPREERMWMEEYMHGYGQEVYGMELSPAFSGHLFCVAAHKAFLMFGVCVFGIETQRNRSIAAAGGSDMMVGADEAAAVDDTLGRERQTRLQQQHMRKLGIRPTGLDIEETDLDIWRRERAERSNAVLLINPKDYIIRTGDRALIIADDFLLALRLQEWDGSSFTVPHITPADKTTFRKLNNGRGPLLRDAKPRLVPSEEIPVDNLPAPEDPSAMLLREVSKPLSPYPTVRGRGGSGGVPPSPSRPGRSSFGAAGGGGGKEEDHVPVSARASTASSASSPSAGVPVPRSGAAPAGVPPGITAPALSESGTPLRLPWPAGFGKVDEASNLKGHIVICGAVTEGLKYLLEPLHRESSKPVIVMHKSEEPPIVPVASSLLRDVFFLHGSSLNLKDLHRAGLGTASCAIILANPADSASAEVEGGVQDLEAVFTTCVVEANFRQCRLIVEILDPESMKFMNFNPSRDSIPRALWPQYACGRVYIANALDTLLCQAFYNNALIPVVTRLVIGNRENSAGDITAAPVPAEGSSDVPPPLRTESSSLGSPLPDMGDGLGPATILGPSGVPEVVEENSRVMHMQIPVCFVNRHYKDLFAELILTKGILPLGLFRSMDVHGAVLPYVIANPGPLTVLHPDDRLFVLCSHQVVNSAVKMAAAIDDKASRAASTKFRDDLPAPPMRTHARRATLSHASMRTAVTQELLASRKL